MKYASAFIISCYSMALFATGGPLDFPVTMQLPASLEPRDPVALRVTQGLLYGFAYCLNDQVLYAQDERAFFNCKSGMNLGVNLGVVGATYKVHHTSKDVVQTLSFFTGCVPGIVTSFALKQFIPEGWWSE